MVNAVINPLTAILSVPNGELVTNFSYEQLMDMYVDELAVILRIQNVADMREHVKQVCRITAGNRSSMLKDLENGRQTEIDAILGYVLHEAQQTRARLPDDTISLYDDKRKRKTERMRVVELVVSGLLATLVTLPLLSYFLIFISG